MPSVVGGERTRRAQLICLTGNVCLCLVTLLRRSCALRSCSHGPPKTNTRHWSSSLWKWRGGASKGNDPVRTQRAVEELIPCFENMDPSAHKVHSAHRAPGAAPLPHHGSGNNAKNTGAGESRNADEDGVTNSTHVHGRLRHEWDKWTKVPFPEGKGSEEANAMHRNISQMLFNKTVQAETWTDRATKGEPKAMMQTALRYITGIGVEQDFQKAECGSFQAMQMIGEWYLNGTGPYRADAEAAVHWLDKAADAGSTSAMYSLGILFMQGNKVSTDLKRAVNYWARAANEGHAAATYNYATMCLSGTGVPTNHALALELFETAAEAGAILDAGYNAGLMYILGNGVEKDYSKGLKWLRWAADRLQPDAELQLGTMYARGQAVVKDTSQAVEWFLRSIEHGDNALAMCNLGLIYMTGDGVPKDDVTAMKWFQKASFRGNSKAQFHFAKMKMEGTGCAADPETAHEFMRKSAKEQGEAKYMLGTWLLEGKSGLKKDAKEAVRLLESAAKMHSNENAFFMLGKMFAYGVDGVVKEDCIRAYGYLYEAYNRGHPDAKREIDRLSSRGKKRDKEAGEKGSGKGESLIGDDFDYSKFDDIDSDDFNLMKYSRCENNPT
eukprot:jgi/Bigna1/87049/estExt_fgenesh1_pg.C_160111